MQEMMPGAPQMMITLQEVVEVMAGLVRVEAHILLHHQGIIQGMMMPPAETVLVGVGQGLGVSGRELWQEVCLDTCLVTVGGATMPTMEVIMVVVVVGGAGEVGEDLGALVVALQALEQPLGLVVQVAAEIMFKLKPVCTL